MFVIILATTVIVAVQNETSSGSASLCQLTNLLTQASEELGAKSLSL